MQRFEDSADHRTTTFWLRHDVRFHDGAAFSSKDVLATLEAEDPSFKVEHVKATHEMVVHGMSDLHLQVMEQRLKRRYGVEITTRPPRIAMRSRASPV